MSANTGVPPAQDTACALAANVMLGITTRPRAPSDCRTSISPAVHEDTATTCGTWSRSASDIFELADRRPVGEVAEAEIAVEPGAECRDVAEERPHQREAVGERSWAAEDRREGWTRSLSPLRGGTQAVRERVAARSVPASARVMQVESGRLGSDHSCVLDAAERTTLVPVGQAEQNQHDRQSHHALTGDQAEVAERRERHDEQHGVDRGEQEESSVLELTRQGE